MRPRTTTWAMEKHTRAKHELLRSYLKAWFPIHTIQGRHERVIFLDGFAGPGIYDGGDPGSPIIALEVLITHNSFPRLAGTTFEFVLVEKERDRLERLEAEIARFWSAVGGRPANVHVRCYREEFVTVAQEIMPHLRQSAPTFAFIDPFGWKDIPMSVIRDMALGKCDVLVTFMAEYVSRFVGHPDKSLQYSVDDLFGTGDYRQAAGLTGDDRKLFLRDLYVKQLREMAGFTFAKPFEFRDMRRPGARTMYFLMFGTHHVRGLDRMKSAMWKLDPEQGVSFLGLTEGEPLLFEPEPNLDSLEAAIRDRFTGHTVPVRHVEDFVITDTDYTSSHYKAVLRSIEERGLLEGVSGRTKRLTYPPDTVLRFLPARTPISGQLSLGDF